MIRFKKQKKIDYSSVFSANDTFTRFFPPYTAKVFKKKKYIYIIFFFKKLKMEF